MVCYLSQQPALFPFCTLLILITGSHLSLVWNSKSFKAMAAMLFNFFKGQEKPTQEELTEKIRILKNDKGAIGIKLENSERQKEKLKKENDTIKAEK